ncbi:hypothetical protein [Pseudomonas mangiferae]|uniref:Lipoprotein n=1 Tax=Pseudomonas mangiferae TaxID=2593654 RepID=A0A553GZ00_9PSED|nr:hypothetical protein [Pseudomonas mangiferae]TRX74720.1 hypothetical protein FM069_12000 [Pseudomonas mangiferae]
MILRASLSALLCLLLAACATAPALPARSPALAWPLSLHVQRLDGPAEAGLPEDSLLVIQAEDDALRWSLFDPLGVPLARQRLDQGAWHNDGLLPPNPAARELFAALLFGLVPDDQLDALYPAADWRREADGSRVLQGRWRVTAAGPGRLELRGPAGERYRTEPLANGDDAR